MNDNEVKEQTVSIAMATYNGAKYLQEQLDSFLNQTRLPDELIVSDDGSTDDTIKIVNQFKEQAPFAVIILQNEQSLGVTGNFNRALENCSGDYVFLSDQDDVWDERKIESIVQKLDKCPETQLVLHDFYFCNSQLVSSRQTKFDRQFISPYRVQTGMATAIRHDFLRQCLPIPRNVCHDVWLHMCASFISGKEVMFDVLAYFRRHDKNTSQDGILKSGVKVSYLPLVLERLKINDLNAVKSSMNVSINNEKQLQEWAKRNKEILLQYGLDEKDAYYRQLKKRQKILKLLINRRQLLDKPKFKRSFCVIKLYLLNGYNNFNGFKSAIKDLLRY